MDRCLNQPFSQGRRHGARHAVQEAVEVGDRVAISQIHLLKREGWKSIQLGHARKLGPGTMTVAESHAICDRIEETLRAEMQHLVITIHVEPEAKAKQHGVPVL